MCTFFTGVQWACLSVFLDKQGPCSSVVERILGKDEVGSSILLVGSIIRKI